MYGRGSSGFGFGPPVTPPVIKQLLIANAAVFVLQVLYPKLNIGAVSPFLFWQQGYLWQPFTYMWLHAGLGHLGMNMFVLWMFGTPLALVWGARRFLRFYLICGVGAGFIIATYPYLLVGVGAESIQRLIIPTLGASGAIYGVLLAYSLTWPDRTIVLIFPPVVFRAIWLIPLLFFMTVLFGGGNVSHTGHLGGILVGWLYLRWHGEAGSVLSLRSLKLRWRRYRMRRKLRSITYEDHAARRRRDDRTFH